MTGPQGRQLSLFPENFNASQGRPEAREALTFKGDIASNFEAGNSLNLTVVAVVNQHWQVTVRCISSDVIDFAKLPA